MMRVMLSSLCVMLLCVCAGDGLAEVEGARGKVPDAVARREVWVSGKCMIFEGGVLWERNVPKQALDDWAMGGFKDSLRRIREGKPERVYPKGQRVKFMQVEYFEFVMGTGMRVQCFPDSVVIEDEEGMKDYRDTTFFFRARKWIMLERIKSEKTREVPEAKIVPAGE